MSDVRTTDSEELKARLKELEDASKLLSKQIGQAKKNKDSSADQLIAQKKTLHSSEIAPIKAQLKAFNIENQSQAKTKAVYVISAPNAYIVNDNPEPISSSLTITISSLEDETDLNKWNQYINKHPMGNIYYQSAFLTSIQDSLGHRILLIKVSNKINNSLTAILPIIEQKSTLFGHLWTSIALVNYGGVLADSKGAEEKLLQFAETAAKNAAIKRLEIRGLYERPSQWTINTEKASMWLKLPESHNSDELLNSFKAKLRSQIKKGYTNQVSYKIGGLELINDYYHVFARNMRDLGTPVYGKNLFQGLLRDLGDKARLVLIYFNGQPASAAFLIQNKHIMEIPWASTIREYNQHNLNMVLYWEVLKFSCERNCSIFDFGRSSIDASTYQFKKQWGSTPIQHYWYSFEPSASPDTDKTHSQARAANSNNPKFQLLIAVWKKLPLWLANVIGPHIVKYIP